MKPLARVVYCGKEDSFFKKICRQADGFLIENKTTSFSGSPQKFAQRNRALVLLLRIKDELELKHQEWLSKNDGTIPIIVISQAGTIETAIHALQYGIFDYYSVSQPVEIIIRRIQDALINQNVDILRVAGRHASTLLIGNDPLILENNQEAREEADRNTPILIVGEVGTGREHLALAIHHLGRFGTRPLLRYDCRMLRQISKYDGLSVAELIQVHLQPIRKKHEYVTLFLNHLEDLSAEQQLEIFDRWKNSNIRIISSCEERKPGLLEATNLARVRVIRIPPLRHRKDDIPVLTEHFLLQSALQRGIPVKDITRETLMLMTEYSWPGNVQELLNVIDNMVAVDSSSVLTAETWRICHGQGRVLATDATNQLGVLLEALLESGEGAWKSGKIYEQFMQKMEKILIDLVLPKVDNNQALAAKVLGISRNTLRQRLKSA